MNWLKKVNAIDTSGLIKITDYDIKMIGIEGKKPSITSLSTTAVLNAVKHKISNVSNLVKKKRL